MYPKIGGLVPVKAVGTWREKGFSGMANGGSTMVEQLKSWSCQLWSDNMAKCIQEYGRRQ
jgi:hypothetical protein